MESHKYEIELRISSLIKNNRQKLAMSQHELADGICSQPMISSIERGDYLPNAALFMKLCIRLNISLDQSFLSSELPIGSAELSAKIFELCKKHQYSKMISYMDQPTVFDELDSDEDFQTYYYYYACGVYQLNRDVISVKRYLNMATAYMRHDRLLRPNTEIEMLIVNALGVIESRMGHLDLALSHFETVHSRLSLINNVSENLNVIDYQYGYALYLDGGYSEALNILLTGLDRVTELESYFMLPEYALLIMNCYEAVGNAVEANRYKAKFDVFNDLI